MASGYAARGISFRDPTLQKYYDFQLQYVKVHIQKEVEPFPVQHAEM